MAYVNPNFKTKKALKEAVAKGEIVTAFEPGIGSVNPNDDNLVIEGPHFPEPHRWYAGVTLRDGRVTKVR